MAKQNNSLTELQALEGIYEHLSTIDDLAKEVGTISTRLRKIEEQLKEPVDSTDPTLGQGLTRDTCIYGTLSKLIEICRELKDYGVVLDEISSAIRSLYEIRSGLENICKEIEKAHGYNIEIRTFLKPQLMFITIIFAVIILLLVIVFINLR